MIKFWKICAHEYTRHVLRRRFLMALLSVPLWIAFSLGLGLLSLKLMSNNLPAGYVDLAGVMVRSNLPYERNSIFFELKFEPFRSEAEARTALDAKAIQAYILIPADYRESRSVTVRYLEEPDGALMSQFRRLLTANLLDGRDPLIIDRLISGPDLDPQAPSSSGSDAEKPAGQSTGLMRMIIPMIAAVFMVLAINSTSGYLVTAVVEEKQNRTMEILATSASTGQIMGAKICALIAVGMTQVLTWASGPLAVLVLVKTNTPYLDSLDINGGAIGLMLLLVLPTFVMVAALIAAAGATVIEVSEGQGIAGLISMTTSIPLFVAGVIIGNPSGPIALAMTFIPPTAALTVLLRISSGTVPPWQIAFSAGIVCASAVGSLLLAGRLFRAGMLRYGQAMRFKEIFKALVPGLSKHAKAGAQPTEPAAQSERAGRDE